MANPTKIKILSFMVASCILMAFFPNEKITKIYLIGDSTMMDYEKYREDYLTSIYPLTGWG